MAHYGAILQRSPQPFTVIGHYYPDGEFGKIKEIYRVRVTEEQYQRVIKQIRKQGGTMVEKDEKLFQAFKPADTY